MNTDLYKDYVNALRKEYPSLSLESTIDDIEKTIETFGITVKYSDMSHIKTDEEISGYVHVVDGKPEIVINGLQPKRRQRFTMAHELGHALIHWEWLPGKKLPSDLVEISYRREYYSTDVIQRENQADNFAAEFLAPIDDVVSYIESIQEDTIDKELQISLISDRFNISNASAYYRWVKAQRFLNG
ncbi:ImmA/IrrE family metallo-endopeptidase [Streptococcus jiangjianxini]|uniref:ImmA/IrrE family metallo-endopeptidase n=1 Tax=Streptococcus jiangjianxini TaxID=3161189 RepID=UPI0032ED5B27